MKKIFTLLTVFVLSLTVANAQITKDSFIKLDGQSLTKAPGKQINTPKALKSKSTPNKIDLADGERIVGFYTTDDLPDLSYGGYLGLTGYPGQIQIGAIFEDDVFKKYVGGEITKVRFALGEVTPVAGLYIYEVDTDYNIYMDNPLAYVDLTSITPVVGWNDVTLSSPVTIESDKYYFIAYEYTQTTSNYPVVTDMELDVDITPNYGMIGYGDFYGTGSNDIGNFGSSYGSVCIQTVVKGGSLIDDDISISNLSVSKYANAGGNLTYSFSIKNEGNVVPTSYILNVSIDGTVVETLNTPIALSNSKQTVSGSITVPSDLAMGNHTFSIEVASINGSVPTENIDDDVLESTLTIYEGAVERQMHLMEQFTSVQCGYCPLGTAVLQAMQTNNPGKYAWVAIHCPGMGDDPYYLTDGSTDDYEYYVMPSGSYYPAAAFNRYLFDASDVSDGTTIAMSIGYYPQYSEYAAELFDELVNSVYDDLPAFASVDIDAEYDASQLTIKVSGEGVTGASNILDGQRITVYLIEDGLVSSQLNYYATGYVENNYVHNNVLRAIISNEGYPWGDEINWTTDNTYENDYVVTLDDSWTPENMRVVAFISKSFAYDAMPPYGYWYYSDFDEGYVNNTNMVALTPSTGISKTVSNNDVTESSRFTMDGRQLSSPAKGLNIVKMSDGSVRKVIVK